MLKEVRSAVANETSRERFVGLALTFWTSYQERRALDSWALDELNHRAARHASACCLARVDGKSPVEYLDSRGQALARSFARRALDSQSLSVSGILHRLLETLDEAEETTPA